MITHAFVIKNFIPIYNKVQILHPQYGKITCVYPKKHQAALLTTGSIILCDVTLMHKVYTFQYLEIIQGINADNLSQLHFIHQVMLICLKTIPNGTVTEDIFNFLGYIYKDMNNLSDNGKNIALLRLFLLIGVLPIESPEMYKVAMLDPYVMKQEDDTLLQRYVKLGWDCFNSSVNVIDK